MRFPPEDPSGRCRCSFEFPVDPLLKPPVTKDALSSAPGCHRQVGTYTPGVAARRPSPLWVREKPSIDPGKPGDHERGEAPEGYLPPLLAPQAGSTVRNSEMCRKPRLIPSAAAPTPQRYEHRSAISHTRRWSVPASLPAGRALARRFVGDNLSVLC